jgi:hypothetical protein
LVRDLSKTFRDLNAVTMQLKTGECLKIRFVRKNRG